MNIRIGYLYRDGSNHKLRADRVFANPRGLGADEVLAAVTRATGKWRLWPDVLHFRPERVALPTCYFTDHGYAANDDDLDLHEIEHVETTAAPATDERTIADFLVELSEAED